MTPTSDSSAAAKTFLALQALGVRDVSGYLESLKDFLSKISVTYSPTYAPINSLFRELTLNGGINFLISHFLNNLQFTNKRLIVIGNGGMAAIALYFFVC